MPVNSLPITVSEGDFGTIAENGVETTPLAKIATRMAEAIINTAWEEGKDMKDEVAAKITALTGVGGILDSETAPTISATAVTVPTVTAPNVDIPENIDTSTILATYSDQWDEIVTLLETKFAAFRTAHFPDESAAYSAAEDWLQAAIADPSGLPATVRAQLLGDDQARILADASRASDAVLATFAARRFPLPPGAAAAAVTEIQTKAQDAIAESSRKITIEGIKNQHFVVEKLLDLRKTAMSAALDYIKAMAMGPDMASRLVGVGYDAQSRLISAAADFYRADTSAKEMMTGVAKFNSGQSLDAASKNQAAELQIINAKIEALLTEIKSVAQMATGMLNNLHANAGMSVSI